MMAELPSVYPDILDHSRNSAVLSLNHFVGDLQFTLQSPVTATGSLKALRQPGWYWIELTAHRVRFTLTVPGSNSQETKLGAPGVSAPLYIMGRPALWHDAIKAAQDVIIRSRRRQ